MTFFASGPLPPAAQILTFSECIGATNPWGAPPQVTVSHLLASAAVSSRSFGFAALVPISIRCSCSYSSCTSLAHGRPELVLVATSARCCYYICHIFCSPVYLDRSSLYSSVDQARAHTSKSCEVQTITSQATVQRPNRLRRPHSHSARKQAAHLISYLADCRGRHARQFQQEVQDTPLRPWKRTGNSRRPTPRNRQSN